MYGSCFRTLAGILVSDFSVVKGRRYASFCQTHKVIYLYCLSSWEDVEFWVYNIRDIKDLQYIPDIILCGWLGSKHQLSNKFSDLQTCALLYDTIYIRRYTYVFTIIQITGWGRRSVRSAICTFLAPKTNFPLTPFTYADTKCSRFNCASGAVTATSGDIPTRRKPPLCRHEMRVQGAGWSERELEGSVISRVAPRFYWFHGFTVLLSFLPLGARKQWYIHIMQSL